MPPLDTWHASSPTAYPYATRVRYLDEDADGMVTAAELATLGRAVDLESVAHFAGAAQPDVGALPVEMVVPLVQEQLRSHAEGPGSRYWVLLSLSEAESLRGSLHVRQERAAALASGRGAAGGDASDALSDTLVALHTSATSASTQSELLDAINYVPSVCPERQQPCTQRLQPSTRRFRHTNLAFALYWTGIV